MSHIWDKSADYIWLIYLAKAHLRMLSLISTFTSDHDCISRQVSMTKKMKLKEHKKKVYTICYI